jgi:diadenosine tetraphosphate (Ap4A) HIT family hydrolase
MAVLIFKENIVLFTSNGGIMSNPDLQVAEWDNWAVYVMPDQRYFGRLVVVLKRSCETLSDLDPDELLEWHQIVRILERGLKKTFNATMFNWSCLMNNAYQEENPQPQVHWHFRPRYNHPVEFNGHVYHDPNFGHHYLREDNDRLFLAHDVLKKIALAIREDVKMYVA